MGERQGRFDLIRGLNNPEDLFWLEGTDWVLTGNLGDRRWASGGFYLVDRKVRAPVVLKPDFSGPAQAPFDAEAPDPDLFSAHGISVEALGDRRFRVHAVNHGGRRSIEVFELDARPAQPVMTWVGGVVLPKPLAGNSVAPLPGGGFAVTITVNGADPDAVAKARAGQPCGLVIEWSPGAGWSVVPGSELSGPNGLVASPDGAWLYIAAYTGGALYKLSRGQTPYVLEHVQLNVLVDNIRRAPSGALLATGHAAATWDDLGADNRAGLATSRAATAVFRVDPETLAKALVLVEQATADFGGGTSAVVVGDELWIGGFRSQCLATVPLAELGGPDL